MNYWVPVYDCVGENVMSNVSGATRFSFDLRTLDINLAAFEIDQRDRVTEPSISTPR